MSLDGYEYQIKSKKSFSICQMELSTINTGDKFFIRVFQDTVLELNPKDRLLCDAELKKSYRISFYKEKDFVDKRRPYPSGVLNLIFLRDEKYEIIYDDNLKGIIKRYGNWFWQSLYRGFYIW